RGAANDCAELDFPVELGRVPGLDHVVARPADTGGRLHEHDRLQRHRQPGFLGVVGIVQADGDELADADIGHAVSRHADHERHRLGLEPRQRAQLARRDLVGADVVDRLREAPQAAFAVDHAGLLVARLAIPAQLHIVIPPSIEYAFPVAKSDSSEARNTRIPVMSSTVPSRPMGWRATKSLRACTGSAKALILPCSDGVSTVPWHKALHVLLYVKDSAALDLVSR